MRSIKRAAVSVALIFLFCSFGLSQFESASILDINFTRTSNELKELSLMYDLVNFMKNDQLSGCDFFGLPKTKTEPRRKMSILGVVIPQSSEDDGFSDLCSQTDLKAAFNNFDQIKVPDFLNKHNIAYSMTSNKELTFNRIKLSIEKNKPIILVSKSGAIWDNSRKSINFSIITGYKYTNAMEIYSSMGGPRLISLKEILSLDIFVIFLDSASSNNNKSAFTSDVIYKWENFQRQDGPQTYICRKKGLQQWIYGEIVNGFCNAVIARSSAGEDNAIADYTEYLNINSGLKTIWESNRIIFNQNSKTEKSSFIGVGRNNYYPSNPICRVDTARTSDLGEFDATEPNKETGKVEYGCKSFYLNRNRYFAEDLEILSVVSADDNASLDEFWLRSEFKQERAKVLKLLQNSYPLIGKTEAGEIVNGYRAERIESILELSKKYLLMLVDGEEKLSGLERYIKEDFPSIKPKEKLSLSLPSDTTSILTERSVQNNIFFHDISYKKKQQTLFILAETFDKLNSSVREFFKPIADNKLVINLSVEGSPDASEVIIGNAKGVKKKDYIAAKFEIYRGKYNISVSRSGYKQFTDSNFNLVQTDSYNFNCKLSALKSDEPSVCKFQR